MNQPTHPSEFPPQDVSGPQTLTSQPVVRRVKCTVPGCGKLFNRKEHLTRHLKSHDPQRQHQCPICGRRYARSDVLKRHVEHHAQDSTATRTAAACTSCHERKLKCDDHVPCRACSRSSTECSRTDLARRSNIGVRIATDTGKEDGVVNGSDQMLTNGMDEMDDINDMSGVLPSNDPQQPWFQPVEATWSLQPFSAAGLPASSAEDLSATSLGAWAVDTQGQGHIECAFSAAESQDPSFLLPTTNGLAVEHMTSASRHEENSSDGSDLSLALRQPNFPTSAQEDRVLDLEGYLKKQSVATTRLVEVYFSVIHPHWPILHSPTFDAGKTSNALLGSMVMLASWLEGKPDHAKLAPLVLDSVNTSLLECCRSFGTEIRPSSLHTLQGFLLCVVYSTLCPSTEGTLARAVDLNGTLVSTCRRLGIFGGQHTYHGFGDCPYASWLAQEQVHRLAFSVLCLDAYVSLLVDHPPSVRYQEMRIPLPKSTHLWTAASEDERRSLQWNEPAGREKALFYLLIRDALDFNCRRHLPYRLTEADYHLCLCSIQVGIWEAAREAHNCESDELLTDPTPKAPFQFWRTHLDLWRVSMENGRLLRQKHFPASTSTADDIFSPFSLILWHLSALTLHAPIKLLQGQGCCFKCGPDTAIGERKDKARLSAWLALPYSRVAIWNAAQISRVIADESASSTPTARLLLNPLAIPSVQKSAVVTCWYAYHTLACPRCTGRPPPHLVDLFGAEDGDVKLMKWKEQGTGLASWGPGGITLCKCQVVALVAWFRGMLARDEGAEMEFMTFITRLCKG